MDIRRDEQTKRWYGLCGHIGVADLQQEDPIISRGFGLEGTSEHREIVLLTSGQSPEATLLKPVFYPVVGNQYGAISSSETP